MFTSPEKQSLYHLMEQYDGTADSKEVQQRSVISNDT